VEGPTARDLHVEVPGDCIIVTLPGSGYSVTYYKGAGEAELVAEWHSGRTEHGAPMTQAEFHASAWKAANDKTRELGVDCVGVAFGWRPFAGG
jgi:hypothetical protein